MKLYTLRHRRGNHGVMLSFVQITNPTGDEAKDFRIAEQIGVAYCNQQINTQYIRIEAAVLASEAILDPKVLEAIINPPPPKNRVRERLKPGDDISDPDAKAADAGTIKVQTPASTGDLDKILGDDDEDEDDETADDTADDDADSDDDDDEEAEEADKPKTKAKSARKTARKTSGRN